MLWTGQLLNEFESDGFPKLKHLTVENVAEILYIINSTDSHYSAFLSLESLYLENLMNLEKICNAKLTIQSFRRLKYIKASDCDELKNLLSFSGTSANCFVLELEEIEVTRCNKMTQIICCELEDGGGNNLDAMFNIDFFSQLRSLRLRSVPELVQLYFTSTKQQDGLIANSAMPFFDGKVWFLESNIFSTCSFNL